MMVESVVEINGHLYRYEYVDGATVYKGPVGDAPTLGEQEFLVAVQRERYGIVRIDGQVRLETDKAVLIEVSKSQKERFDEPKSFWFPKSQVKYAETQHGHWILKAPIWLVEDRGLDPDDFWAIRFDRKLHNRSYPSELNDVEWEWLKEKVLDPRTQLPQIHSITNLMWKRRALADELPEGATLARVYDKLMEMYLDHEVVDVVSRGPVPDWKPLEWKGMGKV